MHAVRPGLGGEIGPVVEDERDAEVVADAPRPAGHVEQRPGFEVLLAQLHEVDAAGDARLEEALEIGAIGRAEVEPPLAERDHGLPAGDGPDELQPVTVDQPGRGGVAPVDGCAVALDEHPPPTQAQMGEQVVDRRPLGQLHGVAVRGHLHERERTPSHSCSPWPILAG